MRSAHTRSRARGRAPWWLLGVMWLSAVQSASTPTPASTIEDLVAATGDEAATLPGAALSTDLAPALTTTPLAADPPSSLAFTLVSTATTPISTPASSTSTPTSTQTSSTSTPASSTSTPTSTHTSSTSTPASTNISTHTSAQASSTSTPTSSTSTPTSTPASSSSLRASTSAVTPTPKPVSFRPAVGSFSSALTSYTLPTSGGATTTAASVRPGRWTSPQSDATDSLGVVSTSWPATSSTAGTPRPGGIRGQPTTTTPTPPAGGGTPSNGSVLSREAGAESAAQSRPRRVDPDTPLALQHLSADVELQRLLASLAPDSRPLAGAVVAPAALRSLRGGGTSPSAWPTKMAAVVEGDLVLGGLMMVHEREDTVVCGPIMPQGGIQALEAMLFTLDVINADPDFLPGVTLGAHILDDCDKDTYGLEMAVDFIKGSISNIDDAEVQCNQSAARKVISGVVGAASSVTSIQVANLLRLFRIPQVSFFSTSPELSNKQRFEFFSRTIPSDHHQVAAMVEIVKRMNWTYVSIVYEESNYGIKAYEELERVLALRNVCIAVKEKLEKDSGVADEESYDKIVDNLLSKPRARGVIVFASDQEVAGVMRAVRRKGATGRFSWIGSDGWSARALVSDGNEPEVEGTLSVQPQANKVAGFEDYFLNLTPENNRRNPWFVEFWEAHFHCRYKDSPATPYNQQYKEPCAPDLHLNKDNTDFEDQLQFVSDAVMAFAHAVKQMHLELCGGHRGLCDAMQPTEGNILLGYLRNVSFSGLSGDKFQFDKNGDGPARYNIIHFKQVEQGRWKWVSVGEYSGNELHLNMSEIQFQLESPAPPESVCSLPCAQGQARRYVERESCCWHCFNCTQYQVRNESDETRCDECAMGTLPDALHTRCLAIPEDYLQADSGWAIGAMTFSCFGIVTTVLVLAVFISKHDTPVVRASGRELSYVLLTGILLCYCVTFLLVLKPTDIVCGLQRFSAGFCFTMVYAALFIKTNRIARIFQAGKRGTKRPSLISPRSQLIICGGLLLVQILINVVWMLLSPPAAIHMYPTREDNVLVCTSHKDASYMIAFGYPIALIVVCTVYAVLTRKIPGAFNESQHIGFTMYTTCVIWLAFVPLFFATANHVALRITSMSVTISLSAFVTVVCLFTPKLYIIVCHPERNVRQSMMPKMNKIMTTVKSSAATASTAVRPAVPSAALAAPSSAPAAGQAAVEKQHKATQSDEPPQHVANGGIKMSRSQQTSLQDLLGERQPRPEQPEAPSLEQREQRLTADPEGGAASAAAEDGASSLPAPPEPPAPPDGPEVAAEDGDAANGTVGPTQGVPCPPSATPKRATEVITANPARLSSLDYIDMDAERLVQSPPPPARPAAATAVNDRDSDGPASNHQPRANHHHRHHHRHNHHHHNHRHHHSNHHHCTSAGEQSRDYPSPPGTQQAQQAQQAQQEGPHTPHSQS